MPSILFLCTGNYYRSRFAELLFNHLAEARQLRWRSESRGLAIDRGAGNIGPISTATLRHLASLGIVPPADLRFPQAATEAEFTQAARVIALKEAEHRPLMLERFPTWADRIEYWHVHDLDFATAEIALPEIAAAVELLVEQLQES